MALLATLAGPAAAEAPAALGAALFRDPALSAGGAMACAACHDPATAFSAPEAAPAGGRRNAPGLLGVARQRIWGWDGRHATLAAAALAPLIDPAEMANPDLDTVARRIAPAYAARFTAAFGPGGVTPDRLGAALAAYLSTLDSPTRYDRFRAGEGRLDAEEMRGLALFTGRAGCAACHGGPALTDGLFHNLGLSAFGEPGEDLGRFRVTGRPGDAGAFRTPSLRHVGRTAPYMHSGHFATLEGVVRFYAGGGGRVWARNQAEAERPLYPEAARVSPLLRRFDPTEEEVRAIAAFLRSL